MRAHLLHEASLLHIFCYFENIQYKQIVTINKALESINLQWDDILLIIADNTSVNPSIAKKVKKPMIGCQSHVLALAVKEFSKAHLPLLLKMNDLCKMFRTPKYRGALRREGCTSSPKLCGHKWGATYSMLETYFDSVGETIELRMARFWGSAFLHSFGEKQIITT